MFLGTWVIFQSTRGESTSNWYMHFLFETEPPWFNFIFIWTSYPKYHQFMMTGLVWWIDPGADLRVFYDAVL